MNFSSTEEEKLSGSYILTDDRYWTSLWRDPFSWTPKEKSSIKMMLLKLSGKRTEDRIIRE